MDSAKEKKAKLQIIIAVLILTIIFFAELYLMINFKTQLLVIVALAVVALGAVYILSNALMVISAERDERRNSHYESIAKSEKASYIMLKKSFDEIEERLNELQENSQFPAEEIINAQKGIAKVIINRSKENADAIINSNDQVLERLDEVEETQNTKFTSLSKEQRLKLTDFGTQTDLKLQDLIVQLKDTELRLNQAIMSGTKVVMPTPGAYVPMESSVAAPVEEKELDVTNLENLFAEANHVIEETEDLLGGTEFPAEEDNLMDLFATEEYPENEFFEDSVVEPELAVEPEVVAEPVVEEIPPMPDMSDPNKKMSPDDIAALFANLEAENTPAEEPIAQPEVVVEPVVEDVPPMPNLSDPNKQMSPDDIAALFANMAGGDAPVEEVAEVENEIEAAEELPPMPDLSDPNKVMSPEDIAALIANL